MGYVPSEYWVRVKVTEAGSGVETYHAAQSLAWKLASENPGMLFEVMEEKVWASARCDAPGGINGTQELQDQAASA